MLFKLIGVILLIAAGVLRTVQSGRNEREKLKRMDSLLRLTQCASEQILTHGTPVPEFLLRHRELCGDCGAVAPTPALLLQAARESLPEEGCSALESVFVLSAGTIEEQTARCRNAVRVLGQIREQQAKAMPGNIRSGTVLPLSAAAIAILLLW